MRPALEPAFTLSWLARFVEEVSVVEPVPGQAHPLDRLPDGRTSLVFRALEGGGCGDVTVLGPRTRAVFKNAAGLARAVILRFKPGWAAPLLGVPASALTDRYVKLDGLWGRPGSELVEDLLATRSAHDAVDRLVQAVWGRAQQAFEPASARIARRAVRLLEGPAADPGAPVRVESVARQLGITPRHLRRAFTESVGIGPKDFARTVRLRRTLRMVGPSADWGRIAADAGYYDQAHLIAEFRELVGFTPGAFLRHTAGRSASGLPSPLPSCRSGLPTRDRRFGKSLLPP